MRNHCFICLRIKAKGKGKITSIYFFFCENTNIPEIINMDTKYKRTLLGLFVFVLSLFAWANIHYNNNMHISHYIPLFLKKVYLNLLPHPNTFTKFNWFEFHQVFFPYPYPKKTGF